MMPFHSKLIELASSRLEWLERQDLPELWVARTQQSHRRGLVVLRRCCTVDWDHIAGSEWADSGCTAGWDCIADWGCIAGLHCIVGSGRRAAVVDIAGGIVVDTAEDIVEGQLVERQVQLLVQLRQILKRVEYC